MSVTAVHGYPDWGRYLAQQDVVHVNETNIVVAANNNTSRGPFPTFGALGLAIFLVSNSGACRLVVSWFADSAATTLIAQDRVVVRSVGYAVLTLPVRGAFVKFRLDAPVAVGFDVLFIAANARGVGPMENSETDSILLQRTGTNVNAGATSFVDILQVRPGWAHWQVNTALATFTCRLMVTDLQGTNTNIAVWANGMAQLPVLVMLPPMPIRFELTNTTGAAGTYNAYLVSHPLGGDF